MRPPRAAPHAWVTDEQRRAERGHDNAALVAKVKGHIGKVSLKELVKPTVNAQNQAKKCFLAYLTNVSKHSNLLSSMNCTSVDELLVPSTPSLQISKSLTTLILRCIYSLISTPSEMLFGFADYLVESSQGKFNTLITEETLVNNIGLFIGIYNRSTNKQLTSDTTQQLLKYAQGECKMKNSLLSCVWDKPISDGVDVHILKKELWGSTDPIPLIQMRHQLATFIGLGASSATWPGNIVESLCWSKSNEALILKDLTFVVLPGSHKQQFQHVPSDSKATLEAFNSENCKKLEEIDLCIITSVLLMALENDAFSTIHGLDDLQTLMLRATQPVCLTFKVSVLNTPVLWSYISHSTIISPTHALTYNMLYFFLTQLGFRAGFEDQLTPLFFHRMGANKLDESTTVTAEQCCQVMGHETTSHIFVYLLVNIY
ncbi:hypothetical protein BV22DRAFT_1134885 [Leucogyrophana mollusca]|uniref:Uncharacterized protein n=1 Tax=Leucogyrophana mollusca TaxID=85980 RepID=A0ACB8AXG1_9AGAM|nr:hypothetical protein BV22DRAFT_1134885 [Leucogyrophana mollusca]